MDWLNFHHLRYFWTVAKEGSVHRAAAKLHVSQPSISAQIKLLEESLGEQLFKRRGRTLVLTEIGSVVYRYAEDIFSAGRELLSAVQQQPAGRPLRFHVGMTDALPKRIAYEILKPAFRLPQPVHVICRQAEIGPLVTRLGTHRLDMILSDEPASSSLNVKTFNHALGKSGMTFCAQASLATKLRKNFPHSLDHAPALLPSENMGMRGALDRWFDAHDIKPRLVGEFEDGTLMEVAASGGLGFTAVHSVVDEFALRHYGLKVIARVEECGGEFFAITTERKIRHPAIAAITEHAHALFKNRGA